jgi:hypothetical protein
MLPRAERKMISATCRYTWKALRICLRKDSANAQKKIMRFGDALIVSVRCERDGSIPASYSAARSS